MYTPAALKMWIDSTHPSIARFLGLPDGPRTALRNSLALRLSGAVLLFGAASASHAVDLTNARSASRRKLRMLDSSLFWGAALGVRQLDSIVDRLWQAALLSLASPYPNTPMLAANSLCPLHI
jgi:hypothetical protein